MVQAWGDVFFLPVAGMPVLHHADERRITTDDGGKTDSRQAAGKEQEGERLDEPLACERKSMDKEKALTPPDADEQSLFEVI